MVSGGCFNVYHPHPEVYGCLCQAHKEAAVGFRGVQQVVFGWSSVSSGIFWVCFVRIGIHCFSLTGLSHSRRTLNLISCHCSHKNCNLGTPWNPYAMISGKHHLLVSTIQFNRWHPKGMLGCGRHHPAEREAHAASNGTPHGPFGSGVVARGFLSGKLSIRHLAPSSEA